MPRIPDDILGCAIYLYPDEESARTGRPLGGSGFLLGVEAETTEPLEPVSPFPEPEPTPRDITPLSHRWFCYAVTNRHVAERFPVIRMNTLDGRTDIVVLRSEDWLLHPKADLSVTLIDLKVGYHASLLIDLGMVLTLDECEVLEIGIGDDVNMVGRFINHEGRQTNAPSVRFGNISMMPGQLLRVDEVPELQEALLVETRTVAGYSGSPVFLEVPVWELLANAPSSRRYAIGRDNRNLVRLLGITGGWIYGKNRMVKSGGRMVEGWKVESNTAMMWCVPSYRLLELLNQPEVRAQRDAKRIDWSESRRVGSPA